MAFDLVAYGVVFISGIAIAPLIIRLIKAIARTIPIVAKWIAIAIMVVIWVIGFLQVVKWLVTS